jgi:hypothetical protein
MESVMIHYDGTVRNSVGQLIQLRWVQYTSTQPILSFFK